MKNKSLTLSEAISQIISLKPGVSKYDPIHVHWDSKVDEHYHAYQANYKPRGLGNRIVNFKELKDGVWHLWML